METLRLFFFFQSEVRRGSQYMLQFPCVHGKPTCVGGQVEEEDLGGEDLAPFSHWPILICDHRACIGVALAGGGRLEPCDGATTLAGSPLALPAV